MDWLRAYEGERGVAYLLAIVAAFAPTVLALFLLQPLSFASFDWPQTLLLAVAEGGLNIAISVSGVLVQIMIETKPPASKGDMQIHMIGALVLGSVFALAAQGGLLASAIWRENSFEQYLRYSLLANSGLMLAFIGHSLINRIVQWGFEFVGRRRRLVNRATPGVGAETPLSVSQSDSAVPGELP